MARGVPDAVTELGLAKELAEHLVVEAVCRIGRFMAPFGDAGFSVATCSIATLEKK